MMTNESRDGSKGHKEDAIHLTILLLTAFLLGVYLIASTVLITQDGVYYIKRALELSHNPKSVIMSHPPGYPFLILIAFKFVGLFNSNPSAQTLAYTAQSMTLLCRLLSIIPLYFIGKLFVGARNSFWALLILILLPYPAKFGSDVLRDWPHILFLAMGFLFLLWGSRRGKWWFFGITGLIAGLGFTIRPECAQLVLYGILWLFIQFLRPKSSMSKGKIACAFFILMFGFILVVIPYWHQRAREGIVPTKLRQIFVSPQENSDFYSLTKTERDEKTDGSNRENRVISLASDIIGSVGRLIGEVSDNLMYYFLPALLIGIYYRFRKQSIKTGVERFFMFFFIILNIIMMILLYQSYGYISRRHCLPLVVFLIFYVHVGLQVFAGWLNNRFSKGSLENNPKSQLWFYVLVAVGIAICVPKFLRPMRIEKKGYRDAARWLKENTAKEDLIAVSDHRIGFYAERDIVANGNQDTSEELDYIVSLVRGENEVLNIKRNVRKEQSFWVDERKKKDRLIIYKVL